MIQMLQKMRFGMFFRNNDIGTIISKYPNIESWRNSEKLLFEGHEGTLMEKAYNVDRKIYNWIKPERTNALVTIEKELPNTGGFLGLKIQTGYTGTSGNSRIRVSKYLLTFNYQEFQQEFTLGWNLKHPQ